MAFKLENYSNDAGVPVAFWKITNYSSDTMFKYVDASFSGWVSEELCIAGKSAVEIKRVRCMADKFDSYFSTEVLDAAQTNPLQQMYVYAKENSEFFSTATRVD
jgi:hypothetical protein